MASNDKSKGEEKKTDLQRNMEKALEMKKASHPPGGAPEHRTSHEGMHPNPNEGIAPSGALNAEGNEPVLSRSHGVRKSDKG